MRNLLLWVLVLPVAALASLVMQVVSAAIMDLLVRDVLISLWNSWFGSMTAVCVGAWTAPKHRLATALVLAVLATCWSVLAAAKYDGGLRWVPFAEVLLSFVGAVMGCAMAKEFDNDPTYGVRR